MQKTAQLVNTMSQKQDISSEQIDVCQMVLENGVDKNSLNELETLAKVKKECPEILESLLSDQQKIGIYKEIMARGINKESLNEYSYFEELKKKNPEFFADLSSHEGDALSLNERFKRF